MDIQTELPGLQIAEIILIAREWIGTPYHHQMSVKGSGCDCLGLIRGVYREFYGEDAVAPGNIPPYSRAWGESTGEELMLEAAAQHLICISIGKRPYAPSPGDVLVFRMRRVSIAKHAAIYVGNERIIHSVEGRDVSEVNMHITWWRKIAGVFRFKPKPEAN